MVLSGLSISREHALVSNTGDTVTIQALHGSKTFVNGDLVEGACELHTGDRVILGNNYVFRYEKPGEESKVEKPSQEVS